MGSRGKELGALLYEDKWLDRLEVAKDPNTSIKTLMALAKDKHLQIIEALLCNKSMPEDLQLQIFEDQAEEIKEYLYPHLTEKNKSIVDL